MQRYRGNMQKPKRLMVDPDTGQEMKMPKVTGALIKMNINNGPALYNLGTFELHQKNYDSALKCLKAAYEAERTAETLLNLSTAYRFTGHTSKCVECLEKCIKNYPEFALAYNNLGLIRFDENNYVEADRLYKTAIKLKPDYADAHWNYGLSLGLELFSGSDPKNIGNFIDEYSWRFQKSSPVTVSPTIGTTKWVGEPLIGKKLLILCEQGLGDMIQFLRYCYTFPPDQVILHMPDQLHCIIDKRYEVTNVSTVPHDYWIPMCDLLKYCEIGNGSAYITSLRDPALEREVDLGNKYNIGIVWKGSAKHQNDANRSLHFRDFFWLFDFGKVWSLQKDEKLPKYVKDIESLKIDTWADTYNYIKALDVVITVDTSVAHLAGAMGKKTIILIPGNGIDWRWGKQNSNTVWYKSAYLARNRSMEDAKMKLSEWILGKEELLELARNI